jgi:DNA-binding NarL/FixJ family response regulator
MQMSELDAFGVIKNLAEQNSAVKVLVLSSYNEPFYIEGVLEYGAAGYLTKDEGPEVIVEAVGKVAKGERGLFSQKAKRVLREIESAENSG